MFLHHFGSRSVVRVNATSAPVGNGGRLGSSRKYLENSGMVVPNLSAEDKPALLYSKHSPS